MTLKEFADVMRDEVAKHFNEDWQIEVQQHVKNNNWLQTQLMIRKKDEQVGMLIPMELFYPNEQDVLSDEKFSEISAAILCFYEEGKEGAENMNRCIPALDKYQNIRDMVRYKVINAEKNSELLQSVPHILYLDLAIVFYICFKEDERSLASGLIHNSHLDMWKVTVYDIYEDAKAAKSIIDGLFEKDRIKVEYRGIKIEGSYDNVQATIRKIQRGTLS